MKDLLEEQSTALENNAKIRKQFADRGVSLATSDEELDTIGQTRFLLEELEKVYKKNQESIQKNGVTSQNNNQKVGRSIDNLRIRLRELTNAEENYRDELSKQNALTKEKQKIMDLLGMSTSENNKATEEAVGLDGEMTEETRALIEIQKELLEQAKEREGRTEWEGGTGRRWDGF